MYLMFLSWLAPLTTRTVSSCFVSNSTRLCLAVLQPRKLIVFTLSMVGGAAGYCEVKKNYEHKLPRTACNFCAGPFGGSGGRDFICVQSMDGQLFVLQQEAFAFAVDVRIFVDLNLRRECGG
jgi:hypothetical protein